MTHTHKAIFIGGPLDGQTKAMRAAPYFTVIQFSSRTWAWRQRRYVKVHESADGATAVYEFEPYAEKFYFTVEVDAAEGSSEKKVAQILNDLLQHIDGHHEAFPAGVTAARVLTD